MHADAEITGNSESSALMMTMILRDSLDEFATTILLRRGKFNNITQIKRAVLSVDGYRDQKNVRASLERQNLPCDEA